MKGEIENCLGSMFQGAKVLAPNLLSHNSYPSIVPNPRTQATGYLSLARNLKRSPLIFLLSSWKGLLCCAARSGL